ncbi:DUF4124 domain-containing protein [Curvibacter sp. CHRR-16]|uniref:DUF4124 domain-containing protein n=1 Tax=Curvibacter sp. CHRR-16 TaxID=2835872 RepID=UPI001BDA1D8F|nr:DUF4124 domain-containing protein [Curvibacter sp. CHRR-16]MBT0570629.1 DUF4124 domain-containing protein [Curvibacter sp. CHRR-16]
MKARTALVFAMFATAFSLANAQWVWLDSQGRKVFSDRPPGNEIPAKNILKQPAANSAGQLVFKPLNDTTTAPSGATATANTNTAPASDPALEAKKKQAEAQEAAKVKAEQERQAQAKADNCARAKQAKATYDSGRRIAQTDAKGEVSILTDEQRAVEVARIQGIIAQTCN